MPIFNIVCQVFLFLFSRIFQCFICVTSQVCLIVIITNDPEIYSCREMGFFMHGLVVAQRRAGQALNEVPQRKQHLKRMSYREIIEREGHSGKSQGSDRACTQGWHYTRLLIVFTINKQFLCFIKEEKLKSNKFLIVVEPKYNL